MKIKQEEEEERKEGSFRYMVRKSLCADDI